MRDDPDLKTLVQKGRTLREASELVRRVEAGEEVTITVAGRPTARLVAVTPRVWRQWTDLTELFSGPNDPTWLHDRDQLDQDVQDPWASA